MEQIDIYGGFRPVLERIKETFEQRISDYTAAEYAKSGIRIYEHLIARVKSEESALENARAKAFRRRRIPL